MSADLVVNRNEGLFRPNMFEGRDGIGKVKPRLMT